MHRSFITLAVIIIAAFVTNPSNAQEPITSPAATQPSAGHFVLRNQLRYLEAREHPITGERDFREWTIWNNLAYGISRDLSVNLTLPVKRHRFIDDDHGSESHWGVGDPTLLAKWRIHQHDFGPIDTSRFSIIGGMQFPAGTSRFSARGWNPIIGGVYTHVQGRHGLNVSGQWKFNTGRGNAFNLGGGDGRDDALLYDASYLFRIDPVAYGPDTHGALYAVLEMNGIYETNGDNELFLSPGIMYEARTWTLEGAVRLPVWQDLDRRPETRFVSYVGLRLLF